MMVAVVASALVEQRSTVAAARGDGTAKQLLLCITLYAPTTLVQLWAPVSCSIATAGRGGFTGKYRAATGAGAGAGAGSGAGAGAGAGAGTAAALLGGHRLAVGDAPVVASLARTLFAASV